MPLMPARKKKSTQSRKPASASLWQWVVIGLVVAVVVLGLYIMTHPPGRTTGSVDAIVIDQLSPTDPNPALRTSIRESLETYGLDVIEYQGEEVDVDLYRSLGLRGCRVLFIRSHAGLLVLEDEDVEYITALFTNEPYSRMRYVDEQLRDQVLIVRPFADDAELSFGVSPYFVARSMEGHLPSTVVIIAGCSCLEQTDLAKAFLGRGASVVISWDDSVSLDYLDAAMGVLMRGLFDDGLSIGEAVEATMSTCGVGPEYGARLTYFPFAAGPKTVDDLIG
ncbi:MAG: hypothetical protein ACOC9B_00565 [Chloroflexota bacterium]